MSAAEVVEEEHVAVEYALAIAETLGVPVFPVKITPGDGDKTSKVPLTKNGHLDASTDPELIRRWWAQHPNAAIGGVLSAAGMFAIDVDVTGGVDGEATLADAVAELGDLPATVEVLTPSGGRHLWYRGEHVKSRGWRPGVDIKGDGGWVVLAGSYSPPLDDWYRFEISGDPFDGITVAEIPPRWRAALPSARTGDSTASAADTAPEALQRLHELDREAVELLCQLGGHHPFVVRQGDGWEARITRPGKRSGTSATVGHLGPGVVRLFTPNWETPGGYRLQDRPYDLDDLARIAQGLEPLEDREPFAADLVPQTATAAAAIALGAWRAETLAALIADPPCSAGFLIRRLWPSDAYGIIGAESKAGKTWLVLDLAVSIACGVPALDGIEVDRAGPVVVFLGEGGRRNAYRRLRAVCSAKGIDPAEVDDLHLIYRAPKLSDEDAAENIEAEVARIAPVAIIVDPLYLAAPGADGANLYSMAVALERLQSLGATVDAAVIVVHHWNQSGKGDGFGRFSGAGPEEWGRVLWSVAVDGRTGSQHPEGSAVRLTVRVRGGELADLAFSLTREVWSDDPEDLGADLHYRIERGEIVAADTGKRKLTAEDRCAAVLAGTGEWMTAEAVQDADADAANAQPDQHPMKSRTVQDALARLAKAERVERSGVAQTGYLYRAKR